MERQSKRVCLTSALERLPRVVLFALWSQLPRKDVLSLMCTSRTLLKHMRPFCVQHWIYEISNRTVFFNRDQWKRDIRHVCMDHEYRGPLLLSHVPKLKSLYLGEWFNRPLDLRHVPNLTSLDLGYCFNQPLDLTHVPQLTRLILTDRYNHPLQLSHLIHLTYLDLGYMYNHAIDLSRATKLTRLSLSTCLLYPVRVSRQAYDTLYPNMPSHMRDRLIVNDQ